MPEPFLHLSDVSLMVERVGGGRGGLPSEGGNTSLFVTAAVLICALTIGGL
jgi:hypothetical protein